MSASMGWEYVYTRVMGNPFGKLVAANYTDSAPQGHGRTRPRRRQKAGRDGCRSPAKHANPLIK